MQINYLNNESIVIRLFRVDFMDILYFGYTFVIKMNINCLITLILSLSINIAIASFALLLNFFVYISIYPTALN